MVLPGHLAGGYVAARILLALTHPALSANQIHELALIGLLAGEAPDIDLFFLYIEHRFKKDPGTEDHRSYITHAPLTWLIISLLIAGIGYIFNSTVTQYAGFVILAGSWSHFILDSIEYGIRWLWPFSNRRFRLRDFNEKPNGHRPGTLAHHWEHITTTYIKSWTVWIEIVVVVAAVWVALH